MKKQVIMIIFWALFGVFVGWYSIISIQMMSAIKAVEVANNETSTRIKKVEDFLEKTFPAPEQNSQTPQADGNKIKQ